MGERRGMKALELWCKKITDGYAGVKVENMTTSWRDGLAFCALIHHFRPDLIDFPSLEKGDVYANNELAFRVAERHLGIPALLDAEDMALYEVPDRLSILTYLSQFYQVFASQGSSPVKRSPEPAERSMVLSSGVQSAPTKEVRRRGGSGGERCGACGQPVFLAQRLLVGHHLYHRTCFRCARCSAQLSLANCYETMDGQYCCETCPDEEELELHGDQPNEQKDIVHLKESVSQQKDNIHSNLNENSVSQLDTAIIDTNPKPAAASASLVGVRKLMFESGCELTDDDKVRKGSLDRFSDRLKTDATLDTKCAQLGKSPATDNVLVRLSNVRLGKDHDVGSENRKSLEVGSDFGSKYQKSVGEGANFGSKNRKRLEIWSDFGHKPPKSEGIDVGSGFKNRRSLEIGSDFASKNSKSPEIDGVSGYKNRRSLEVDGDVGSKSRKSLELDANVGSTRLGSGFVGDIGKAKDIHRDSIPFIDSVESVNFEEDPDLVSSVDVSKTHSNLELVSPVVDDKVLNDSDCKLEAVDVDSEQHHGKKLVKIDVDVPLVLSSRKDESNVDLGSKLDVHQDTYVEMKPLTPEPEEMVQEPIYEEIPGNLLVHEEENLEVVEGAKGSSDDFVVKDDEIKGEEKLGDEVEAKTDEEIGVKPLDVVVESEVKPSLVSAKIEDTSFVEVITPPKRNRKVPLVVEKKIEPEKRISTGSVKEQIEYPSELNPFGDDEEEEEEDAKKVESKEEEKMKSEVPVKKVSTSLNPFGSDDEDEEEEEEIIVPKPVERKKKNSPAPSTNPFESDEDEEEEQSEATSLLQPVPLPRKLKSPPLSPTPKPRSFHSRNSSMSSSIGVPVSPSPRKKKPAPPPPPLTPKQKKTRPPPPPPKMLAPDSRSVSPTPSSISNISSSDLQEKSYKDASNRQKQSGDYIPHKSVYGTWKRKKAPAPLPPIAHRRPVKPMPIKQLRQELKDIEIKQQGLERQGVTLEQTIREKFDLEASMTPYVEELILQLFELVNEKNELFRRQAELMYLRRQHHLEEEHAELEYQIRCLMLCPEQNKTDSDKEREEQLIQRLVDIVERRNEIVQCLEMDRLREAEEDRSVSAQLNTLSAAAMGFDSESSRSTTPDKKGEKKSKKEKKKGKIDIDKDIDEGEKEEEKKKKKSKKKWFTLPHSPKRL